jgi:SAM-dependent methyltransferase
VFATGYRLAGKSLPSRSSIFKAWRCHRVRIHFFPVCVRHLKDPIAALRQFHRVLKPGGLVAVRSPDWGGFLVHPLTPEIKAALEYYQKVQSANGGDVNAGRKLKEWAETAGFKNAQWSGSFEFVDELGAISEYLASQLELNVSTGFSEDSLQTKSLGKFATALRLLPHQLGALFAGSWGELIAAKALAA